MDKAILLPGLALAAWSLFMLYWGIAARFSALSKAKIDLAKSKPGGRGSDLDGVLPDPAQWPVHNYNHLMEQPTVFYATVGALAIMGVSSALAMGLAWTYVGLRMVHSVQQATNNFVPLRFLIFLAGTIVLSALVIMAVIAAL